MGASWAAESQDRLVPRWLEQAQAFQGCAHQGTRCGSAARMAYFSVQLRGSTPEGHYSRVLEGFGLDFATVTRIQARTLVGNPEGP